MRSLRCFHFVILAVVLAAGSSGFARAADPEKVGLPNKEERKAFDDKVRKSLFDLINRGVDLYNANEWASCYSLYEGSLRTIAPLLDHHPDLQKAIAEGLKEAQTMPRADVQAFHLRKVLDKVRADLKGDAPAAVAKTLWDRLGGDKGVGKIVDDLMATVAADPKVNFNRKPDAKPTAAEMKATREKIIDYISSNTGGPRKYEGKSMKALHAGMGITDDQFDAFASHFKSVLETNGVKGDDLKTLVDAVNSTKKDIVETKKPDDKKPDDKKADDKKTDDKKPDDKKADDKKPADKPPIDK